MLLGSGEMDGAPADISPMTLRDIYLKPWAKFFAAGGRGAMLSHNSVNGIPAHMHKEIMTDIIRLVITLTHRPTYIIRHNT